MEERLVDFETAKLAKEKGFDLETNYFYDYSQESPCVLTVGVVNPGYEIKQKLSNVESVDTVNRKNIGKLIQKVKNE